MAIVLSSDGIQTTAAQLETFDGVLLFHFEVDDVEYEIPVNSNKLSKTRIILPAATADGTDGYKGYEVLGSGHAVSFTTTATGKVITSFFGEVEEDDNLNNGIGKITFENVVNSKLTKELVKNISVVQGLTAAADGAYTLNQGAIAFLNTGASVPVTPNYEGSSIGGTTTVIRGGTGVAKVTHSGTEFTIRLDEAIYPINIDAADSVTFEPLGSSIIFTG